MIEQGYVSKIDGNLAEILIDAKPECSHCEACIYFSSTKRKVIALNNVNAKPHDKVEVYIALPSRIKISFLFYILPVIFFFVFYLIYSFYIYKIFETKPTELISALAGFIGIFFSFITIKIFQKIMNPKLYSRNYIIKVL